MPQCRLRSPQLSRGVQLVAAVADSGGATGADAGTLTLMIGGAEAAFARTRKFLDAFAKNVQQQLQLFRH